MKEGVRRRLPPRGTPRLWSARTRRVGETGDAQRQGDSLRRGRGATQRRKGEVQDRVTDTLDRLQVGFEPGEEGTVDSFGHIIGERHAPLAAIQAIISFWLTPTKSRAISSAVQGMPSPVSTWADPATQRLGSTSTPSQSKISSIDVSQAKRPPRKAALFFGTGSELRSLRRTSLRLSVTSVAAVGPVICSRRTRSEARIAASTAAAGLRPRPGFRPGRYGLPRTPCGGGRSRPSSPAPPGRDARPRRGPRRRSRRPRARRRRAWPRTSLRRPFRVLPRRLASASSSAMRLPRLSRELRSLPGTP